MITVGIGGTYTYTNQFIEDNNSAVLDCEVFNL